MTTLQYEWYRDRQNIPRNERKWTRKQYSEIVYNPFKKSYGVRTNDTTGRIVWAMNEVTFTDRFYGHSKKDAERIKKRMAMKKGTKW